jgi:tetratricopeptide (TPR) repeat protein
MRWLTKTGGSWLLVLDDLSFVAYSDNEKRSFFDTMTDFNTVLQSSGKVLVTSRNLDDWEKYSTLSDFTSIPITSFSRKEAFDFLDLRLPTKSFSGDELESFAASVCDSPLSLNLATSYWMENEISLMQEALLPNCMLLNLRQHTLDQTEGLPSYYPVVRIMVDELGAENPLALEMLCFMSVVDIQGVPLILLTLCCNQTSRWRSDFHRALRKLFTVSMLQRSQDGSTLFLDGAIRDYMHEKMKSEQTLTFWEGKAVEYLAEVFPEGDETFWPQCETLLPHALAVLTYEPADSEAKLFHASLLCKTASYGQQLGDFDDAYLRYHKAVDIYQESKGNDAMITLETANHVATSLYYLKRHEEAEEVSLSILDSYRRCLPPNHLLIMNLYNSLTIISQALGKYENAVEYGTHTVTCYEKTYGLEHQNTLVAKWNVAGTLLSICQYAKALEIYENLLVVYREKYSEMYPDVPETMSAIASVWIELNRVEEGINMHKKAIELMSHILEATHPIVMAMHDKFGKGLSTVGRLTEAAGIQRQSLDTYRSLYSSPSTQSLVPASNLGKIIEKYFASLLEFPRSPQAANVQHLLDP